MSPIIIILLKKGRVATVQTYSVFISYHLTVNEFYYCLQ